MAIPSFVLVSAVAGPPLVHHWQLLDGEHWQIVGPAGEDVALTDATEKTRGPCTPGMVAIKGRMKVDGWGYVDGVDVLQKTTCVDWLQRGFPARCEQFDRAQWLVRSKTLATEDMDFCIDRFEYPNRRGAYPWIMVTWMEAAALCKRAGERLCTEAEWTFACEGEEAMPYPYGYKRDAEVCVTDLPWRTVDERSLSPRDSNRALAEIDRLWQGEPSGTRSRCRSPFGVYDMVGNVDEWTTSVVTGERPSILKGGYWGRVRDRCRPSTRAHGEDFAFYQQGFRCCADSGSTASSLRH